MSKEKVAKMEDKIALLESHIEHLTKAKDEVEQYKHRLCLHIYRTDLPSEGGAKEKSDDCLTKVQGVFKSLGL